jgi:hypothetical protein
LTISPGGKVKAAASNCGTISPGESHPRSPPVPLESHELTISATASKGCPPSTCSITVSAIASVSTRMCETRTRVATFGAVGVDSARPAAPARAISVSSNRSIVLLR